ncbi:MAG: acetate--CoA ligase family protein [Deltaproteobacteria bacterium]|nr:acetate--CoA ligase family protein [Deltaproteobacteria bacterium]
MDLFFNPRSLAVVGVSASDFNLGRRIAQNLQEFNFDGIIYYVGPKGGQTLGRRIYKAVADIPDQVDLAVILVPARFVPEVLEECGQKGIHRAIIESAGFSELGPEGQAVENQLVEVAAKHDIRFIGPNCIGVINLHNGLSVPFAGLKDIFARGKISIISQSGGVGLDYLNVLGSENLGMAKFASIGNKLNVDECDLLEYMIADDQTDIICMYLESIADGRRLMEIARRTSKPILMHKSNVGEMAKEIAQSHTAALSGDDMAVSAALGQVGIARFDESDTLVNFLKILPLPRMGGNQIAVISRSGGHAVIAADACEKSGFSLTTFPKPFLREIEKHFRAKVIRLTNPLDLGDLFDYDVYTRIVEETVKLPDVDSVVFLHTYISAVEREDSRAFLKKLEEFSYSHTKPLATCVSTDGEEMSKLRKTLTHPVFTAPEDAVKALALLRDYRHDQIPQPELPPGQMDKARIAEIIARCRAEERPVLLNEGLEIIAAAGISVPGFEVVATADQAVAAADGFGGPVVLKLISAAVSHKTDIGGVLLGLDGRQAIERGFVSLSQAAGQAAQVKVLVQPMVEGGTEMILGAKRDATFGPVVLAGVGGIFVEVLKDVAMRVVPFSQDEVDKMLRTLKAYPLLTGARGRLPRDISAVRNGVLAVARLIDAFDEIQELDVNPLMVLHEGQGAVAVDARVILVRK